jgi:hypothetical protein
MKRFIVFFIIFFAAAALAATEPDKDIGKVEPEEKARTSPEKGEDSLEELQRDGSWPRPFIPREKIGADSVVSFPADI